MGNQQLGYDLLEQDLTANPALDAFHIGYLLETVISPIDTHFPWDERIKMLQERQKARQELTAALPNANKIIQCLR